MVMRMIGHRVLQSFGDSTSLVRPIEHLTDNEYKISFESDLFIDPDQLSTIVDEVMSESDLSSRYIVEVVECGHDDSVLVVYNYLMDTIQNADIIPCKGRQLSNNCYSLIVTLLNRNASNKSGMIGPQSSGGGGNGINFSFMLLAVMLLIALAILWKRYAIHGKDQQQTVEPTHIVDCGKYRFDHRNMHLEFDGDRIELSSKEADLLKMLLEFANSTVERDEILNKVWGDDGDYIGRTLDVFISKLRKKLERDDNLRIANIRGVGYRLILN